MFNFVKISKEIDFVNEINNILLKFTNKFVNWIKEISIKLVKNTFEKNNKEFSKTVENQLIAELELFFIINSINIEDEFYLQLNNFIKTIKKDYLLFTNIIENNIKLNKDQEGLRKEFISNLELELFKFCKSFEINQLLFKDGANIDVLLSTQEYLFVRSNILNLKKELYL